MVATKYVPGELLYLGTEPSQKARRDDPGLAVGALVEVMHHCTSNGWLTLQRPETGIPFKHRSGIQGATGTPNVTRAPSGPAPEAAARSRVQVAQNAPAIAAQAVELLRRELQQQATAAQATARIELDDLRAHTRRTQAAIEAERDELREELQQTRLALAAGREQLRRAQASEECERARLRDEVQRVRAAHEAERSEMRERMTEVQSAMEAERAQTARAQAAAACEREALQQARAGAESLQAKLQADLREAQGAIEALRHEREHAQVVSVCSHAEREEDVADFADEMFYGTGRTPEQDLKRASSCSSEVSCCEQF